MAVKAIFQFLGPDGEDWSEDYWTNYANIGAVNALSPGFIDLRLAMLATNCKVTRIRFVSDDAQRLTAQQDVFRNGTQAISAGAGSPTDLAMVWRLPTATGKSRALWLRGVTDDMWDVSPAGLHTPSAGTLAKMAAWISAMGLSGWGIRPLKRVKLRPPNVGLITLVDGTMPNVGNALITCGNAHGIGAVGDEVIIYQTPKKDLPGLRGHWFVSTKPDNFTFTVPYRTPLDQKITVSGGFVRKAEYDPVERFVGGFKLLHVGHHDTKQKVFGSRGRSGAPRNRHSP